MFHRLWEAARKRPTRALGIAGFAMIHGANVHIFLTLWAFANVAVPSTTAQAIYDGSLQHTMTVANATIWCDVGLLFTGVILGIVWLWRACRVLK